MDMQDNGAADGGEASISVVTPAGEHEFGSVSQAARALAQARHKGQQDQTVEASDAPAVAEASGDKAPGSEAEEGADPARPIDPPKSWTEEDQELWKGLPRETQARLAERERSLDSDLQRRQTAAAAERKALEAERSRVDEARKAYDAALQATLQILQAQQGDEFADIKTQADIDRIAKDDTARYVKWSEKQRLIAAVQEQIKTAQERSAREALHDLVAFGKRQDELFVEKVPEFADPAKAAKLADAAVAVLKDVGFTDQEMALLWTGQARIPLRDHRMQLLIVDGIKFREAQQKAKQAVAKPVPPVQRPGVSQPRGAAQDAAIQALSKRLETSGNLKDAAALIAARRKAAR